MWRWRLWGSAKKKLRPSAARAVDYRVRPGGVCEPREAVEGACAEYGASGRDGRYDENGGLLAARAVDQLHGLQRPPAAEWRRKWRDDSVFRVPDSGERSQIDA